MKKPTIMVLDDDLIVRSILKTKLAADFTVHAFEEHKSALKFLQTNKINIALLDIELKSGINGLNVLEKISEIDPELSVIMISTLTDVNTVVKSIKLGALDFIEKPIDIPKLKFRINKIFEYNEMKIVVDRYKKIKEMDILKNEIIGKSPLLINAKESIEKAGPMRLLLLGETGVGKTPFAKYSNLIVSTEEGRERPFEQINCASLKHDRFVDELFGHIKGAYTGAISDKKGLVEIAEGGDLFLDEIGDLNLECQAELLTYLDNYEYYKLGSTKKLKSKVRIIAATNKNLKKMIDDGSFRKDLYSRISQMVVTIPALRERKDDIKRLIFHFVKIFTGTEKQINPDVIKHLEKFDWEEGNVRDLKNVCEFMCITSRNDTVISLSHIPEQYSSLSQNLLNEFSSSNFDLTVIEKTGYENFISSMEYSILNKLYIREKKVKTLADKIKMDRMSLKRRLIKLNIME